MKALTLLTLGIAIVLSTPAQAQMTGQTRSVPAQSSPAQSSEDSSGQNLGELPQAETRVTPELTQPLEVNQQQSNEFFTPTQRPQTVERQAGTTIDSENLIGPPPGSQTSEQVTPSRELTIPIR